MVTLFLWLVLVSAFTAFVGVVLAASRVEDAGSGVSALSAIVFSVKEAQFSKR